MPPRSRPKGARSFPPRGQAGHNTLLDRLEHALYVLENDAKAEAGGHCARLYVSRSGAIR